MKARPIVNVITMGCSKNLVDSESLLSRLERKGYDVVHNPSEVKGEYAVVNTCGFIADAKEESINMILQLIAEKERKNIGKVVVMGCLSERYLEELKNELQEVDLWYGKFDWKNFIETLPDLTQETEQTPDSKRESRNPEKSTRKLTTPPWSAYIKVSEGCNRFCAFCAIPLITGRHTSRPIEEIVAEVEGLVAQGVKEFNIIAQDLSSYGIDLYGEQRLAQLVDSLASIPGVRWIRLHYLYPADFPMDLLPVIRKHSNVCNYIDIALQHISTPVLRAMNRKITREETLELLAAIRREVPGIHLRTTVMTGFPGETEADFEELKEFVRSQKFERLGGFAYSEEEGTLAADNLQDDIPEDVKQSRLDEIMSIQRDIAEAHNLAQIGKKITVLIEENDGDTAIGRSEFDSPEVDQEVIIHNCNARPGEMVEAVVTGAGEYELYAEMTAD